MVESVEAVEEAKIQEQWPKILEFAFQDLNETSIDVIEEKLRNYTLEEVLEEENTGGSGSKPVAHTHSSLNLLLGNLEQSSWDGFLSSDCDSRDNSPMTSPITSPSNSPPREKRKTSKKVTRKPRTKKKVHKPKSSQKKK